MRLPAGRYLTSKQNYSLSALCDEVAENDFSGHCILDIDSEIINLVFVGGVCILAESEEYRGSDVFREIMALENQRAYAELYSYTEDQIIGALKSNPASRVDPAGMWPASENDPKPGKYPCRAGTCCSEDRGLTTEDPFAADLQTLEEMDLEAMKKRIKEDFKEVISDLDLDHLLSKSGNNLKTR